MRYLSKTLTKISDVTITLKDDTNRATPTIILSNSAYDSRCNYVYIDTFNRYYAVTDVTYSQQKYHLTLKRDAKASFISELGSCHCVVARNANKYNTYLSDPQFPLLNYDKCYAHAFSGGTNFSKSQAYVLTIAGGV